MKKGPLPEAPVMKTYYTINSCVHLGGMSTAIHTPTVWIGCRPLPLTFRDEGFDCEQVKRDGGIVLIRRKNDNMDVDCWKYEVVKVHVLNATTIGGKHYPRREAMPCSEDWGTSGWSPSTLEAAYALFRKLVREADTVGPGEAFQDELDIHPHQDSKEASE